MTTVAADWLDHVTSAAARVPSVHAFMTRYRSDESSGITTCVSGSPMRQLYSSSLGPSWSGLG